MFNFEDDICWCYNSCKPVEDNGCDETQCFRHISNRKSYPAPDVYTVAMLKGTDLCPKERNDNEL